MSEVVQLVTSAVLQIWLSFWVIRRDDRRLTGVESDRGFPQATFWIAVAIFGPIAIPIHYLRTRRSLAGLGLGVGWFVVTVGIIAAAGFGLEKILE